MTNTGQWLFDQQRRAIALELQKYQTRSAEVLTVPSAGFVTVRDPLSQVAITQLIPVSGAMPAVGERVALLQLAGLSMLAIRIGPDPAGGLTLQESGVQENTGVTTINVETGLNWYGHVGGYSVLEVDTATIATRTFVTDLRHGLKMHTGRWYGPSTHGPGASAAQTTNTITTNVHYAVPFYVPSSQRFDRIAVDVVTPIAASTLGLALYTANASDGYPDQLVVTGSVASATAGWKEIVIDTTVQGGQWYYLVMAGTHTGIGVKNFVAAIGVIGMGATAIQDRPAQYTVTRGTIIMPGSFGAPSGTSGSSIYYGMFVRAAT